MIGIEGAVLYVNFYKLHLYVVSKNVWRYIYIFIMHTRFCRFYMISVFFVVGSLQICTNTELTKLSYLSRYWYKLLKPANSGGSFPRNIPKDGATLLIRAGRSKSLELAILCLAMYLGSIGGALAGSQMFISWLFFYFLLAKKRAVDPSLIDVILPRCIVRVLTYWLVYAYHVWGGPGVFFLSKVLNTRKGPGGVVLAPLAVVSMCGWLHLYSAKNMFWYCECKDMCLRVLVAWTINQQYNIYI